MVSVDKLINKYKLKIELSSIKFLKVKDTNDFCKKAYPDHKNGCKNYGCSYLCPPYAPYLKELIEKYKSHTLYYVHFDFKKYKEEMDNEKDPFWTENRKKCNLYYQNAVKSRLYNYLIGDYDENQDLLLGCGHGFGTRDNEEIDETKSEKEIMEYAGLFDKERKKRIFSMEAVGINVISTLRRNHIEIEPRPNNFIIFCSLLCSNKIIKKIDDYF
jgi:predicted metal-binding protein